MPEQKRSLAKQVRFVGKEMQTTVPVRVVFKKSNRRTTASGAAKCEECDLSGKGDAFYM